MSASHAGVLLLGLWWVCGAMPSASAEPAAATNWLASRIEDPLDVQKWVPEPGSAAVVCTQELDFSKPLSLKTAIDVALCNNPKLNASWLSIKIRTAVLGETEASRYPTLTTSVGRSINRVRYPGTTLAENMSRSKPLAVQLDWRLYDFGARSSATRAAQAEVRAAAASYNAESLRVVNESVNAYYTAQTTRADWETKEKGASLGLQLLDAVKRRRRLGVASDMDILQATATQARATLSKARAKSAYDRALADLIYLMGVAPGTSLSLADDSTGLTPERTEDLGMFLTQAKGRHPSLAALQWQVEAAEHRLEQARAEGWGTLDFNVAFYENGRPNQSLLGAQSRETTLGLMLNVPIFQGFAHTYKVEGARINLMQKGVELVDAEHALLSEVVKAYADVTAARDNLETSRLLEASAEGTLASVERKFDRGAADILEVINALGGLATAQQERIQALSEWRSARLRLFTRAGMPLADHLQTADKR